jgi:MoxR-like ATPase
VAALQSLVQESFSELNRLILGKDASLRLALTCLFADGHLLVEDLPGMGKTTLAHGLAKVLGLKYTRVQFTSDLLPADLIGASIFEPNTGQFRFHSGPVFSQLLMADELNRATPKAQSALFPLPESQLDRFLMRIKLGYPDPRSERSLLKGKHGRAVLGSIRQVISTEALIKLQKQVLEVRVSDSLLDYVQRLVAQTRHTDVCQLGLSPRGALASLDYLLAARSRWLRVRKAGP